jgi:hypothetical protein
VTLYCALCLHVRHGIADEAVTIISGTATCYNDMGYFQSGGTLSQAISTWREQHPGGGQ